MKETQRSELYTGNSYANKTALIERLQTLYLISVYYYLNKGLIS